MSAITPLLIGFFSGFHCIAMCGGLCAAICQQQNTRQTMLTNLGRVLTYTLLGGLFAGVIQGASLRLELGVWGTFLRLLMGGMLVLSAMVILFKNKARWLVVQKPLPFWPKVAARLQRIQQANSPGQVLLKGMLWGLIPCGLLYGMLIIAATTADVLRGASFMLFFGLGTVLPLLWSRQLLQRWLQSPQATWLRGAAGLFILMLGVWIMLAPWWSHGLLPSDNRFFTELQAVLALCIP
ncbi:sulfite exporter TauE/SafE family protein [Marinicella meishanensis]|uniref:sulfite exporter TauE/SafE family protein n=1 Tax=Marinicella meishanensis TaxID=2873263 RepID=UPI001CC19C5F|nr:sulfite exporter TauE/SafE family protein [Marinicella sp. NBU2979]